MDIKISQSKRNRLFWLGRYVERTYNAVSYMMYFYDCLIDSDEPDWHDYCRRMGIPCDYSDAEDFLNRFLFCADDMCSCVSYMNNVIGNGMLLRDVVTSETFAYLLLAQNSLEFASTSDTPCVHLQSVLDYIMAFRGSFDDSTLTEDARNITKTGGMVERISTSIRMGKPEELVTAELMKLMNRMYKTDVDKNPTAVGIISQKVIEGKDVPADLLLSNVENVFVV